MNRDNLIEAINEAQRFLSKAESLADESVNKKYIYIYGNRLTGAVKRSSLDLSNALSDLRNR